MSIAPFPHGDRLIFKENTVTTYFAKWKTKTGDRSALSTDGFTTIKACVYMPPEGALMPSIVVLLDKFGRCHAEQTDLLYGEERAKQVVLLTAQREGVDFEIWDTAPQPPLPSASQFFELGK